MCGSLIDLIIPILIVALPFLIYSAWQSQSTTQYYAAMVISVMLAVLTGVNLLGFAR